MGVLSWVVLAAMATGCVPQLEDTSSRVLGPRVLAVRATPAEAEEGETVVLEALWSSPNDGSGAAVDWAICRDRKPLAELGPVSPRCLAREGDWLVASGTGLSVEATIPDDACRLFGPSPPEAEGGQPAGRPVDADPTGGFYVPVRVAAPDGAGGEETTIAEVRVTCGAAGTTRDQAAELRQRHRVNQAPHVALEVYRSDGTLAFPSGDREILVAPGERVSLVARWDACPLRDVCGDGVCGIDESATDCSDDCRTPVGCGGAERYVRFDRATRTVQAARESMSVSWLATGGRFDRARSGVASDDVADGSQNGWQAPHEASEQRLWAVVRDDRGGTTWVEATLRVEE